MTNVPKYNEFFWPVLKVLSESKEPLRRPEIKKQAAALAGLSDAALRVTMASGKLLFEDRIEWALAYLSMAGLAASEKRGLWRASTEGTRLVGQHASGFRTELVAEIDRKVRDAYYAKAAARKEPAGKEPSDEASRGSTANGDGRGAEERIEEALNDIRTRLASELRTEIGNISDQRFELLVLDLLAAMGYAWDRKGIQHTGRSGDGGIDGVINMDPLGIQKVYVQAKKWTGNVGRKEVQSFVGSLAGFQARMGVFITASDFTREARDYGDKLSDKVILVDGEKLCHLMIQHSIGVTNKSIAVPQLDGDYFEAT